MQFKAAVTCTRKADESQINLTDWLIYHKAYFIGSSVIKSQFNMELLFQLRELVIKYLICSIKPY